MLTDSEISVKILSVLHLDWESTDAEVKGRPFDALSFRLIGDCSVSANGKSDYFETDNIIYVPAQLDYVQHSGKEELIVVHFEIIGESFDDFEIFRPNDPETFKKLFLSLYEIWTNHEQGYYYRAVSVLYSILAKLNRRFSPIITNDSYERIRGAVDYIHKNFSDPTLTVEKLCGISNMSDTFFRQLFGKVFATTPLKFINELRVNYATELLETGYYTVNEVSEMCGFSDAKYFSTTFKRITGKTPSEIKKALKSMPPRE